MPRSTVSKAQLRHNPLYVDIKDEPVIKEKRPKSRKSTKSNDFAEENLDPKSTAKVLELAQLQQIEIMGDEDTTDEWHGSLSTEEPYEQPHGPSSFHSIRDVRKADSDDENEIGDENFMQKTDSDAIDPHTLDVSDLAALDNLYPANAVERKTLADVIFAKMADSPNVPAKGDKTLASDDSDPASGLNPKVVEAFMKVGQAMRGSGPLPKIVKVIPSFPAWRRYLALTSPENWHPLACRKVTHIYISSMKSNQAEFYFRHVLLPAFRDNITTNGSLNVHYYEALLRCLFKPAAFFKGFLFPLLETFVIDV
ncbi:hypothetical protein H0H93_003913 [Arthromyces matolae]|nr:hypothetical protein H0H93_003913 [Arthromyces matolae]